MKTSIRILGTCLLAAAALFIPLDRAQAAAIVDCTHSNVDCTNCEPVISGVCFAEKPCVSGLIHGPNNKAAGDRTGISICVTADISSPFYPVVVVNFAGPSGTGVIALESGGCDSLHLDELPTPVPTFSGSADISYSTGVIGPGGPFKTGTVTLLYATTFDGTNYEVFDVDDEDDGPNACRNHL